MTSGYDKVESCRKPKSYRDLLVWQKGMELAKFVYGLSARFPVDDRYGSISQVRRAAISVPSNTAEGQDRHTAKEFVDFSSNAQGLLGAVETRLLLLMNLGSANREGVAPGLRYFDELRKMLISLKRKLKVGSPLATRHSSLSTEHR